MNTQEQQLLDKLLQQLQQAAADIPAGSKDAEAVREIESALGQNPDARYLLVQRHLLMEQALNAAQTKIRELESRSGGNSFLGGQNNVYGKPLGGTAAPAATSSTPVNPTPATARGGMGGSFLGTAAATATGVLGGALLFEGIEHLMHGGMGGYDTLAGGMPTEVTNVTESFYGSDPQDMQADLPNDTGMDGLGNTTQVSGNDFFSGDDGGFFGDGGFFDGGDDWV